MFHAFNIWPGVGTHNEPGASFYGWDNCPNCISGEQGLWVQGREMTLRLGQSGWPKFSEARRTMKKYLAGTRSRGPAGDCGLRVSPRDAGYGCAPSWVRAPWPGHGRCRVSGLHRRRDPRGLRHGNITRCEPSIPCRRCRSLGLGLGAHKCAKADDKCGPSIRMHRSTSRHSHDASTPCRTQSRSPVQTGAVLRISVPRVYDVRGACWCLRPQAPPS